MTRLIFHLGYPKTGSTTLQHRLFAPHPGIAYLSPNADPDTPFLRDPRTARFPRALSGADTGAEAQHLWQTHMVPQLSADRVTLLSEEDLLFGPAGGAAVLERIAALSPQPELLIVLRPQDEIIRSRYDMYPVIDKADRGTGRSVPLADYIDHILSDPIYAPNLRFADRIAQAQRLFGADRVHVFAFDDLFRTARARPRLARLLGIAPAEVDAALAGPAANDFVMHATRRRLRRILGPIRGSWFLPVGVLRAINTRLGRAAGIRRTDMSAADRARITAHFADDTARLAALLARPEIPA